MTKKYTNSHFNYVSNVNPSYPNGFDVEIFSLKLAKRSLKNFKTKKIWNMLLILLEIKKNQRN